MLKDTSRFVVSLLLAGLFTCGLSGCGLPPQEPEDNVDLSALSDDELFDTVYFRTLDLVDSYCSESRVFEKISPAQRVFYILSIYDMEIQNGGLCQFFVNSSRSLAPFVEECLEAVGAQEHKALFSSFIGDNNIDVTNLDSFSVFDVEEYIAQTQRYDFDAFDNSYYELPPLYTRLVEYIRANLDQF